MHATQASTFRRLAAAGYDTLLVTALLLLVTALAMIATRGEAITADRVGAWAYAYRALVAAVVALYFGVAWTARGQTLGMKTWGIRLETAAGTVPGWRTALLRLACAAPLYLALVGSLLLYMAHRTQWPVAVLGALPLTASFAAHGITGRGTLHDRLSGTRIVRDAALPAAR